MKNPIQFLIILFFANSILAQTQHPVQWVENQNFNISADQVTITHNSGTPLVRDSIAFQTKE